jgi:tRNA-splicing ligase RtcB
MVWDLEKLDEYRWQIPRGYKPGMLVPGLIFIDGEELANLKEEGQALEQVANAACLPGIVGFAYAMPDIHTGYGLPIGGVVATKLPDGLITPGGVGYDINCGVRLLATPWREEDLEDKWSDLADELYRAIPSGLGDKGGLKIAQGDLDRVLCQGAAWAVEQGMGSQEDLSMSEEEGEMAGADPDAVSQRAKKRGQGQLGTLGSGNHFVEVQVVDRIYREEEARVMGLSQGQVVVMIHSGSRGLGHQVCSDYTRRMVEAMGRYGIKLPDRQLAGAPLSSPEGKRYFGAMVAAANYAWANRQVLTHRVREALRQVMGHGEIRVVWDVAHNIAKIEEHIVGGEELKLCVHRKGATRALPGGHRLLPEVYRGMGQPVLVPGDMGSGSYVLVGNRGEGFASACHGAGRRLSRGEAKRLLQRDEVFAELAEAGVELRAASRQVVLEEAPTAYKDVDEVVRISEGAGLTRQVLRLAPRCVIKG